MQLNGKTKGAIIGASLLVGVVTGGLWVSGEPAPAPAHQATCHRTVFAGRAGSLPGCTATDSQDQAARKFVGTTMTGCVIGFVSKGGPWGCLYGAIGGAASNIPWG